MTTNCVQTFHEPPSLRPRCSSCSTVGHPRAGTKLHGQGIPRLGKDNRKVAQINRKDFLPGATYAHNPQTLIPHMPVPPQECTPSLSQVHRLSTSLPGLQQQAGPEVSEYCSCYETPSRRTHFLNTLSHLERVSHRPDNLPLLSSS
jgi:hypothetical protein